LVARSTESSPSSFAGGGETVESFENRAKEVVKTMNSGTKGFDPFREDTSDSSSFDFEAESSVGGEQAGRRPRPYSADDGSGSPSSTSRQTQRVRNLMLNSAPGDNERLVSQAEEEKREVDDEKRDDPESIDLYPPASPVVVRPDVAYPESAASSVQANNNLLRSVLEDARRLSRKSASVKSKRSRLSAPPRVYDAKTSSTRHKIVSAEDLLADHQDLEEYIALHRRSSREIKASSKSVNAVSSRRSLQLDVGPNRHRARFLETGYKAEQPQSESNSLHKVAAENAALTANAAMPLIRKGTHSVTQSASEASPLATLGAHPRDKSYEETLKAGQSDTPASSPGILGITLPSAKDSSKTDDNASSESEGLSNPWLFDAIEQTLGPRSPAADMESISGRSNRSGKSLKSNRSGKSGKSHRSHRSYNSYGSGPTEKRESKRHCGGEKNRAIQDTMYSLSSTTAPVVDGSLGEHKSSSDEPLTPRTLEYDLKRLEVQLGEHRQISNQTPTSSITASSAGASRSTLSSKRVRTSKKQRMVIVVPPGKLGVVLADRHDGKGTVVSEVRASSAINGMLSPGDKLVAVDGEDVTEMVVSEITALMASKVELERRLTVLTSSRIADVQEAKYENDEELMS